MNKILKFISFKKLLSTVLACTLITGILPSNMYANQNNCFDNIFEDDSVIKSNYGKISSYFNAGSNITVVNIQDFHCHVQTQKNISNIIKEISDKFNITSVFAEGGYKNISTDWITSIKDLSFRNSVVDKLMTDGNITGSEYYVIKNGKQNFFKGIDDEILHTENLSRLSDIIAKKQLYSDIISKISFEMSVLKNRYVNKRNNKFTKILDKYNNGTIPAAKFYKLLLKYVGNINSEPEKYNNLFPIKAENYKNILSYINISKTSVNINPKKLTYELQTLIAIIKNKVPYSSYKKLVDLTDNFSDTQLLCRFLSGFAKELNINISAQFKELNKFISVSAKNEFFNPVELVEEETKLCDEIMLALSYDNTEYEISYILNFFGYFKNYLNYSLTTYDWKYYKENFEIFRNLYSKYSAVDRISILEQDFAEINKYYDTNNDRNDIFVSNIIESINKNIVLQNKNLKNPKDILLNSDEVIVVITGGFHSEDLKNLLSNHKINTIVVTPNITDSQSSSAAKTNYEKIITEQNKFYSQALAFRLVSSSSASEQKSLLIKTALELLGDNKIEEVSKYLGTDISITKISKGIYRVQYDNINEEIKIDTETGKRAEGILKIIADSVSHAFEKIRNVAPYKGLESIFNPDMYEILKDMSIKLFNMNIFFSDGVIYEIENSSYYGKSIDGIEPEVYSTFLPEIQQMLLERNEILSDKTELKKQNYTDGSDEQLFENIESLDGVERFNESNFAKKYFFIPKISAGNIFISVYKTIYDKTLKITTKILGRHDDKYYHHINRNGKNIRKLLKIINNSNIALKFRLTAFMYLSQTSLNNKKLYRIRKMLTDDFLYELHKGINFKIENSFDLKAAAVGFTLLLNLPDQRTYDILKEMSESELRNNYLINPYSKEINFSDKFIYSLEERLLYYADLKNSGIDVSKQEEYALINEFFYYIENDNMFRLHNSKNIRAFIIGCIMSVTQANREYKANLLKNIPKSTTSYSYIIDIVTNILKDEQKKKNAAEKLKKITGEQKIEALKQKAKRQIKKLEKKAEKEKSGLTDEYEKRRIDIETDRAKRKINRKLAKNIKKVRNAAYRIGRRKKIIHQKMILERIEKEVGKKKVYQKEKLIYLLRDKTVDFKYRLLSLMYLYDNGLNIGHLKNIDYIEQSITKEFIEAVKSGEIFEIKNNLDLRALATGVMLVISDMLKLSERNKFLLLNIISSSVLVKEDKNSNTIAKSNMAFVVTDPLTIAHEIGHLILIYYEFYSRNKETTSIHELFADLIANIFGLQIGKKKIYDKELLYTLFADIDYSEVFQEEHDAARGFLYMIDSLFPDNLYDKHTVWITLKDVLLEYILNQKYFDKDKQTKKQGVILRDVFIEFLMNIDTDLIKDKTSFRKNAAETVFQAVSYEIIENFSNKNPRQFIDIVNSFGGTLKKHESYKNNSKKDNINSGFYELANSATDKDITDFLFSNIFSNPKYIKEMLKMIKDYVLKNNRKFDADMFSILIKIELILNDNFMSDFIQEFVKNGSIKNYDIILYNIIDKINDIVIRTLEYLKTDSSERYYTHSDYRSLTKTLAGKYGTKKNLLSMDWLLKFLSFIGINEEDKQQKIVVAVEYPVIIIGMFFPKIRNWFLSKHSENIENKLEGLENKTASKIKKILKVSVDEIKNMPFLHRISNIIKILSNASVKLFNKSEHLIANGITVDTNKENKQIDYLNDKAERNNAVKILNFIVFLTLSLAIIAIVFFKLTPVAFVFIIFPASCFITAIFSILPVINNKIYKGEKYESYYYSNIPEEAYDYSDGSGLSVTVQIPVYKEENKVIFRTIIQSLEACDTYNKKSGKTANVLISDDGLAFLLGDKFSEEEILKLMNMPFETLSPEHKQAVERIKFYRENNISFVARPAANRKGRFKKASNLNHTYSIIDKLQTDREADISDGTIYEGQQLFVGEIILMLDKDSELHKDVISVTVPKFIKDNKLAFTQNSTNPSNYGDNYFSKFTAIFTTFLNKQIFSQSAIFGGLVPFVGHNGFIRKKHLDEIGRWPENRVSEDYYTSTRFFTKGYHGKYLDFDDYEFKEMVSRSYIEEASKISRYVFGLLELIFNKKETGEQKKGIFTNWFKEFMASKYITISQKINFFIYPLSYVNIIFIIPAALFALCTNPAFSGLWILKFILMSIPFFIELYKSYNHTEKTSEKDKRFLSIVIELNKDIVSIAVMFISFSYIMIKSMLKFIFNYKKANFGATNVDDDNYSVREAIEILKKHFLENKSAFLLFIPFVIISLLGHPEMLSETAQFGYNFSLLSSLFQMFSFFIASIILNPFLIYSLKDWFVNFFRKNSQNINIVYTNYADLKLQDIAVNEANTVRVFVSTDIDLFDKKDLINTGLKVKGHTIWCVKDNDNLIFVVDYIDVFEMIKTINKNKFLEKRIRKILKLKRTAKLNIQMSSFSNDETDDIYIENGIITAKSYLSEAANKILSLVSVSYAQKTIISLSSVSDDKLYQALSNGTSRKALTEKQFEFLKQKFSNEGSDVLTEISKLKQKGIEVYIITDNKENNLSIYGVSGYICGDKIYDYYTDEYTEIECLTDEISFKEFERKILYLQTPLLVELSALQKILSRQNILDTYNMFDTLIGNIKIKFGISKITLNDIKSFAYNIDLSDIPDVKEAEIEKVLSADTTNFFNRVYIKQDDIIGIIIGDTKISTDKKAAFLEIIKERIIVKHKLEQVGKDSGLADKNIEVLFGRLLKMQIRQADKQTLLDEIYTFRGNQSDMIKKVNELKLLLSDEKPEVLNTMIELIMAYADEKKYKNITKENKLNISDYRKMLAAA